MSFITRCPACGTTFKVVADQLKISDGWVRCGHCADVFDATLTLQNWGPSNEPAGFSPDPPPRFLKPTVVPAETGREAVASTPTTVDPETLIAPGDGARPVLAERQPAWHDSDSAAAQGPPGASTAAAPAAAFQVAQRSATEDPDPATTAVDTRDDETRTADFRAAVSPAADPAAAPQAEPAPPPGPESRPSAGFAETTVPSAAEPLAAKPYPALSMPGRNRPADDDLDDFDPFDDAVEGSPPSVQTPDDGSSGSGREGYALAPEPGFVRQARRHAFWRTRGVRASLWALNAALAVVLLLQWVVHERDWLAARHAVLAPWLNTLCRPLACTVQPARQVEALAIDSSQLLRRLGSFYSFEFVLKNSAGMPVAMPALELSLTNLRDEVIVRRVFLPQELPDAPAIVPAEGSVQMDLRLSLSDQDAGAMSGYRALVFYP